MTLILPISSSLGSTEHFKEWSNRPVLTLGRTRRLGLIALLPTLGTLVISWGFATALLAWLFSRRVIDLSPPKDEVHFFRGALVAMEGSAAAGASGSTLYGLAISSVGVSNLCCRAKNTYLNFTTEQFHLTYCSFPNGTCRLSCCIGMDTQ